MTSDFLLHPFKDGKLQPSTFESYGISFADMVGHNRLRISKDENLSRLLDSFHRDKPKGRWGVPNWNLSLVLHQLTKALLNQCRRPLLSTCLSRQVFCWPWVQAIDVVKVMPGCIKISGIRNIGVGSLSFAHFPVLELVGSRGSFLCRPGSHTSLGPIFG